MGAKRVLVIDDLEANRYILRKIVADGSQYQVLEAATGAEGLELILQGVDVVILDINLPDMTGFELIQKAERRLGPKRLPAIINISATFVSGKDKATGLNVGARAYLTHPINPDELIATIGSLMKSNTRLQRVERQRDWAEARTEQIGKEKIMLERFMRSFSHDLRSPLAAATMATGLMLRSPTRRTDELLKIVEDNLRRVDSMVANLLDISHVSIGGGIKLSGERIDLAAWMQDSIGTLGLQVSNPLALELEGALGEVVWDTTAFLRILENLVGNAAKHGVAQQPIRIALARAGESIRLNVSNAGSFPAEVLSNLATPYFISTRSETKGWGLGLPIVKALCESFGGAVGFRNEEHRAVVEIELPAQLA
ncbi:response regulator [Pseudomonas sp. Pseusp97]|uniref:ATP-binding response regulator n=1 Tax=Pseudomonas sp. Pseusp97 TaxID=3243065 RepID=UPI0039A4FEE0